MRTAIVLLTLAVTLVAAGHRTWEDRINESRRMRTCVDAAQGRGSWTERTAPRRCDTCHSRCYVAEFNATAETSGGPPGLCATAGDECRIQVYLITAPCCACVRNHIEQGALHENDEDSVEELTTFSSCEVTFMGVLVNGLWTLPLDTPCNTSVEPLFSQRWISDDYTTNGIQDCPNAATSGATLQQVYNKDYRNGRYPDPCFADSHWRQTHTSPEAGVLTSRFQLHRPNSAALWFNHVLDRVDAPREIPCGRVPTSPPVYAPY